MARSTPVMAVVLSCMTCAALAADPPASIGHTAHVANLPSSQPVTLDGFGAAVSTGTLDRYSGGGLVQNNQSLTGNVSGNSASDLTTGSNMLGGNSLSGSTGLPTIVQNTGNNVLIQTGVIVNVQLKP